MVGTSVVVEACGDRDHGETLSSFDNFLVVVLNRVGGSDVVGNGIADQSGDGGLLELEVVQHC